MVSAPISGTFSITKTGARALTIGSSGANKLFSGGITHKGGNILTNNFAAFNPLGAGAVTFANEASGANNLANTFITGITLGNGIIGGATTVDTGSIHTAGTSVTSVTPTATLGKQTFNTGINYDAVNTAALATTGTEAIFRVILNGTENFNETFWDNDQTWSDIFTNIAGDTNYNIASIFTDSVQCYNSTGLITSGNTTGRSFSISGTDLNWTAAPEPTSALGGVLLGAGLLRRTRKSA